MGRIHTFDGLRGYCAFWVVFVHLAEILNLQQNYDFGFLHNGDVPVGLFFILSGYAISNLLALKQETYKQFIFRRYFRLAPVFLFLCLVYLILSPHFIQILLQLEPTRIEIDSRVKIYQEGIDHAWVHVFLHSTMLFGLFDDLIAFSSKTLIPPGWSIAIEWQFYLIAPFLFKLFCAKKSLPIKVGIFLAIVVLLGLLKINFLRQAYFIGGFPIILFLLGMSSYFYLNSSTPKNIKHTVALFTGLICVFIISKNPASFIWLFFIAFSHVNTFSEQLNKKFKQLFENRLALFLGKISYSAYLVHMLVIYAVLKIMLPLQIHWNQTLFFIICLLMTIIATAGLSFITYQLIEKPAMKWSSRKAKAWGPMKQKTH